LTLERIFPEPGPTEPATAYGDLRLQRYAPPERPYVVACMIVSADGCATIEGGTAGLSSEVDRALFLELRTQVDAVMAGTRTIAIERYGPLVQSAERRERRHRLGLDPVPPAVTATRTLEVPVETPLFQDPDSRIIVLTNSDAEPPAAAARLQIERLEGDELDLAAGMSRLRAGHGVRAVLLEGGPTLLGAMLRAQVVDELFLTVAPIVAGSGGGLRIVEGSVLPPPAALEAISALRDGGYLFVRYRIR
jgi:riboflavin biosynthesis pyrimidine reductase